MEVRNPMGIVLLIVSFLIAVAIVRIIRSLYMKIIGANVMFFNGATQLIIILVLTYIIFDMFSK
jgi:hypothetical protein